jgi:hypothetical protein
MPRRINPKRASVRQVAPSLGGSELEAFLVAQASAIEVPGGRRPARTLSGVEHVAVGPSEYESIHLVCFIGIGHKIKTSAKSNGARKEG